MDSIPLHLQTAFETILRNRSVPAGLHLLFKKWLRFYLDFCRKYHFPEIERKSLDHFLRKLKEKKQTDVQQQQASDAIQLYYELVKSPDANRDKPPLSSEMKIQEMHAGEHSQPASPPYVTSKDSFKIDSILMNS